jgi:DNA-binding response OmpR family regulator
MAEMKKILFIDDNPVDRTIIERLLLKYNFKVFLAESAKDGLSIAEEEKPDLIILDILLPGISGIEVCKKLKNKEATCHIPVIFYTSIDTPKHLIDYESYGAVDYVHKTETPDVLINQVKLALDIQ